MPEISKEDITPVKLDYNVGTGLAPVTLIGGKVEKFVPNVNLSFVDIVNKESCFLNLNRRSVSVKTEVPTKELNSDEIKLSVGTETDVWNIVGDRLQWDVIIQSKPKSNSFVWDLQYSSDIVFYYRPELTVDEISEGVELPEEAVGSYAVYKTDGRKVGHFYRPKIYDSKGEWVWGNLNISANTLVVTAPQKFLDSAVYPVTFDPDFGFTSIGAASSYTSSSYFNGCKFTAPSSGGVISSISYYTKANTGTGNCGVAIYDSSLNLLAQDTGNVGITTTPGWVTVPINYTFTGDQVLWLCAWANSANYYHYYDTGATNQRLQRSGTFETWPSTISSPSYSARLISIYATYSSGNSVVAGSTSYTVTGNSVDTLKGFKVAGASDSYVLTGSALSLFCQKNIVIGPTSYSLSGTNAGVLKGFKVAGGTEYYILTGIDCILVKASVSDRIISISNGSFLFTGNDATLIPVRHLAANNESLSISGIDAAVKFGAHLDSASGLFSVSGIGLDLYKINILSSSLGSFGLTPTDVSLEKGFKISSESGIFTTSSSPIDLLSYHLIPANSGQYVLIFTSAGLIYAPVGVLQDTIDLTMISLTPVRTYTSLSINRIIESL